MSARSNSDEALLALLLEAFAAAKRSGKDPWYLMNAGPLKNRVLLLCGGRLPEPEWDSTPFTLLLQRFPDTLRVHFERHPPVVELLEEGRLESSMASPDPGVSDTPRDVLSVDLETDDARRWRLRRDLWTSVMSVRAPGVFVWKNDNAVHLPTEDPDAVTDCPRLPTLTGSELDDWQAGFASRLPEDETFGPVLARWARGEAPTSALPRHLQHLWYAQLKRLVRDRLEAWFAAQHLPVPVDLVRLPTDPRHLPSGTTSDLRTFVTRCVESMSDAELADLRIPAVVAARVAAR